MRQELGHLIVPMPAVSVDGRDRVGEAALGCGPGGAAHRGIVTIVVRIAANGPGEEIQIGPPEGGTPAKRMNTSRRLTACRKSGSKRNDATGRTHVRIAGRSVKAGEKAAAGISWRRSTSL